MIAIDARPIGGAQSAAAVAGSRLSVGQTVQARVVQVAADGQTLLLIAGQPVAARMPFAVAPGQSLELKVLALEPRLRLASGVPGALAEAPTDGADVSVISSSGRLLGQLARELPPAGMPRIRLPDASDDGLLRDPPRLAQALRQAVDRSGLFYEQHQAQWVNGQRSEAALRSEPQARLTEVPNPEVAARAAASLPTEEHKRLVRQQLDVLHQQALAMRLEIAPLVAVDWVLAVDRQSRGVSPDEEPTWELVLDSHFERLHDIHSRLSLHGDVLRVRVGGEPEAVEAMRARAAELELAFLAAGLRPESLRFEVVESVPPVSSDATTGGLPA